MSASNSLSGKNASKFSINWMKAKIFWFVLSFFLLSFSIFSIYNYTLNTTIDFKGGTLIEVGFQKLPSIYKVRQFLGDSNFKNVNVQQFGDNAIVVNVASRNDLSANEVASAVKKVLLQGYADNISFRRVETVGPKVGSELIETSAIAIFVSIIAMLLYIWIRFELPFAIGSVIALLHDVIITLGCLAFFQIEFGLPIIAALLTIVGYSMNDTVVIYDRIRENLIKFKAAALTEIINLSINEVFTRTLVTSGTTLIALISLLVFGGAILKPFIITMTIGVIVGTYSSIFVASPFLLFLNVKNNFKAKQKKSLEKPKSALGIL